jgi:uncharacterized protein (DUF4415 family)
VASNHYLLPGPSSVSVSVFQEARHLAQESSRGKRGQRKAPTKKLISVRLSPRVLSALRAKADRWQTLIDETLRREFDTPLS